LSGLFGRFRFVALPVYRKPQPVARDKEASFPEKVGIASSLPLTPAFVIAGLDPPAPSGGDKPLER
jgi:hypothetical protein